MANGRSDIESQWQLAPLPVNQFEVDEDNQEPQRFRLNWIQRLINGGVNYISAAAPVVMVVSILQNESIPQLPVPFGYMHYPALTMGVYAAYEIQGGLRALARREDPWRYHREKGQGSISKGMCVDASQKLSSMLVPVGLAAGAEILRSKLEYYAISHEWENLSLIIVYADGPLIKTMLTAAPALGLYLLQIHLMEKCRYGCNKKLKEYFPENHPMTSFLQGCLRIAIGTLDGVILAEFLRQFFSSIGPEFVRHSEYSLLAGALMEVFIVDPLRSLSEVPRPFAYMDVPCARPQRNEHLHEVRPVRRVMGVSTRVAIAITAFGMMAVCEKLIVNQIGDPTDPDRKDPTTWSLAGRLTAEALAVAGTLFLQEGMTRVPQFVRWVGSFFYHADPDPQVNNHLLEDDFNNEDSATLDL